MSELRQAAQAALDLMESNRVFLLSREKVKYPEGINLWDETADALRAALAQPPAPTAQPSAQPSATLTELIAGALYDLMGDLTTRNETLRLGAFELATPACDALDAFAKKRGLSLDNPAIENWSTQIATAQPPAPTAQPRGNWETSREAEAHADALKQAGAIDAGLALRLAEGLSGLGTMSTRLRYLYDESAAMLRAIAAQPVQQPGAEPDMRHPKIQALIGSKARCQIELMLVEQLIEDPDCDLTSMDMEYWGPMHDRLKEALTKAAPAQRQPLSEAQIWEIGNTTLGQQGGWNVTFARAIEAAHGITAATAAQKGEKL